MLSSATSFPHSKNVKANCRMLVNSIETWDVIIEALENVMDCDCVNRLHHVCISWPLFFEYVNDSWIISYNKYVLKAWTNQVMHLGNTISYRYVFILFCLVVFVNCFMILFV